MPSARAYLRPKQMVAIESDEMGTQPPDIWPFGTGLVRTTFNPTRLWRWAYNFGINECKDLMLGRGEDLGLGEYISV